MSAKPPSNRPMTAMGRPPSTTGQRPPQVRQGPTGPRPRTSLGRGAQGSRPASAVGGRASSSMFNEWDSGAESPGSRGSGGAPVKGRVGSAMGGQRTAAARPGSRLGTAAAGGRPLNVTERPVTQQGLAGVRPMSHRGLQNRMVQDKSYYMGLLRSKLSELNTEMNKLNKEVDFGEKERQNYIVYEKKAENLAKELKDLQGELSDYNMLVDKMNTNTDVSDAQMELEQLKLQNEHEAQAVDSLFADRRGKEEISKRLEVDLEEIKRQADGMLNNMNMDVRDHYAQVKLENEQLTEDFQMKQEELNELSSKKSGLEDELAVSQVKQEAMMLHEKLAELETKRDAIVAEMNAEGTPEQQRERLLERVKTDNAEIVAMDKQTADYQEKIEQCHEELRELEEEYEGQQGEKNQKYRELRLKELQIDEFLTGFEHNRQEEQMKVNALQTTIVRILSQVSANIATHDKTALITGMDDYDLAEPQPGNRDTAVALQKEYNRMQAELTRMEEMDAKAVTELQNLKVKMGEMQADLNTFADVDALREIAEEKRKLLEREKSELEPQTMNSRERASQMEAQVSQLHRQLRDNENYTQIVNLQKKLQYAEQNNFAVRDAMQAKAAETNVAPIKHQVLGLVTEHNSLLLQQASRATTRLGSG